MAARRLELAPAPEISAPPPPPSGAPAVVAAAVLVERARIERTTAGELLAEAGRALAAYRGEAAERLLHALQSGRSGEDVGEVPLLAAIEAAQRRLGAAVAAAELAER